MIKYLTTNSIELVPGPQWYRYFTGDISNVGLFEIGSFDRGDNWSKNYCRFNQWDEVIPKTIKALLTIKSCPGETPTECGTANPTGCGP